MQYRLRRGDGAYHLVDDAGAPRHGHNGQFLGFIGSCVDLQDYETAQVKMRSELMELTRLNRTVATGELLASIAHQFNQYLNAISTNASAGLCWLDKGALHQNNVRAVLESIVAAADDASDAAESICGMFKKGTQNKEALDFNRVLSEVLALVRGELQSRHVSVRANLCADIPEVMADRIQLQQVILNLVMNAVQAMDSVSDRKRVLEITSESCKPRGVLISIADSGKGLEAEQIDQIFEPFFTTKRQGTGVGLSICRSIIEAHGGRLWASPNTPRGAVFQFTIHDC